jgi:hypothetical protein
MGAIRSEEKIHDNQESDQKPEEGQEAGADEDLKSLSSRAVQREVADLATGT